MNHRPIVYEMIPAELKARPQWLLWRRGTRNGKPTKLPVQRNGRMAKTDNPATWTSFDDARAAYEAAPQRFDGIGFVFAADDPYFGVDLDDCITDGKVSAEAQRIIDECATYCEVSPSGGGVKLICRVDDKSRLPRGATLEVNSPELRRLEVYPHGRYFAMTGHHLPGTPKTIETRQQQAEALLKRCIDGSRKAKAKPESAPASGNGKPRADRMATALKWMSEHRAHADERDGSRRLIQVCAAAKRAGLDESEAVEAVRLYAKCEPFPTDFGDDDIRKRFADSRAEPSPHLNGKGQSSNSGDRGERIILDRSAPLGIAREYLAHRATGDGLPLVLYHNGFIYRWDGRCYREAEETGIRAQLYDFMDSCDEQKGEGVIPFRPRQHGVTEVLDALKAETFIPASVHPPAWRVVDDTLPPANEMLVAGNSAIHLPTGRIMSVTPRLFTVGAVAYDFNSDAGEPTEWLHFLYELWPDDDESIEALQLWFGYLLTSDTRQQKAVQLIGPRRSGKGTIARLLTKMLGASNVCGPSLSSIATHFGLRPLYNKLLAIIADARCGPMSEAHIVVERLLSIIGEDTLDIPVKFHDGLSAVRLPTRIMLLSNELPRLPDASGTLATRFITLRLTRSWLGREDMELETRLTRELPAILGWAIEGYRKLRERGRLLQPDSGADAVDEQADLGSPVLAFLRDCCEVGDGFSAGRKAVYARYRLWAGETGAYLYDDRWFGRDLSAALPGIQKRRLGPDKAPHYVGLRLRWTP